MLRYAVMRGKYRPLFKINILMKNTISISILCAAFLIFFSACTKETPVELPAGTMQLLFDNKVGTQEVVLTTDTDNNYVFSNALNQTFNISMLGYYITRVELKGPDGESYADVMATGATESEVKGFYHVKESDIASQLITLENVPAGTYNKVIFTLGVEADYVEQGATGGVLDPANGGWLWNWDSGYIGWALEGRSAASPAVAGPFNPDNSVKLHIGGWKDISGNANMINNVKRLELSFPSSVEVKEGLLPKAHIEMDVLKALNGHHTVDFSTNYSVHAPVDGSKVAHNLEGAFKVHHVHQ